MLMEVPEELHREMGCTRAEFLRWLPGATRHAPMDGEGDVFRVRCGGGSVEITIEERPPRRIASIALPVLAVRFCFLGMDAGARQAFLSWFDAYTRRGGG
ncbi:hypothetical protein [Noviherbaspirillum pedocola]|uniref:Uncharacterized protein n=1 Tax=Noviherbaspirillum pedocola TaxID=2801341 RepID=A0A934SY86_9BURK|nr:hypothetical protein [Noviherbaspirillum pedocola]MBK4739051.1 hypothetical protein [Noviherbaspirillum pedocola]